MGENWLKIRKVKSESVCMCEDRGEEWKVERISSLKCLCPQQLLWIAIGCQFVYQFN